MRTEDYKQFTFLTGWWYFGFRIWFSNIIIAISILVLNLYEWLWKEKDGAQATEIRRKRNRV